MPEKAYTVVHRTEKSVAVYPYNDVELAYQGAAVIFLNQLPDDFDAKLKEKILEAVKKEDFKEAMRIYQEDYVEAKDLDEEIFIDEDFVNNHVDFDVREVKEFLNNNP